MTEYDGPPLSPPSRRRGVVLVDEYQLAGLLRLPASWRMLAYESYPTRLAIGVLVEGPDLPECAAGNEPPFVQPPGPLFEPVRRGLRYGIDYAQGDPVEGVEDRLAALVSDALVEAATACEHPDQGGPIYGATRACAQCATLAVLALFRAPMLQVKFVEEPRPEGQTT